MTKEIIAEAKAAAKGNGWRMIGTLLIAVLIVMASSLLMLVGGTSAIALKIIGGVVYFFVSMYLGIGLAYYYNNVYKGEGKAKDIFFAFKHPSLRIVTLKLVGILFLFIILFTLAFTLLALIPIVGIIIDLILYIWMFAFILYYSVVTLVLIENPDMNVMDAFRRSKELTTGHRWTYIWMQIAVYLNPILFMICGAIVCGLLFFVNPVIAGMLMPIISIVYSVWAIVLIPVVLLLVPSYYNKIKSLKQDQTISREDINVNPY